MGGGGGAAGGDATALQPKASPHPGSQSHNPTNTAQPHALTAPPPAGAAWETRTPRGNPSGWRAGGTGGGDGGRAVPQTAAVPVPRWDRTSPRPKELLLTALPPSPKPPQLC